MTTPDARVQRARIIANIQAWCDRQRQLLADLDHWNCAHPDEPPIEMPDVAEMLATAEDMLSKDPGHGPIAPFQYRIISGSEAPQ